MLGAKNPASRQKSKNAWARRRFLELAREFLILISRETRKKKARTQHRGG